MAKQKGIIKLKGTIGDITFYKTQDGHVARERGGIDANRIANDPAFQRTRENGTEFGRAGKSGKLLRTAVRPLLLNAADSRMVSRLTRDMMRVLQADPVSERGQRNVVEGALGFLSGFDFNIRGKLGTTLYAPLSANSDRVAGELSVDIESFVPINMIAAPSGTTHFKIISAGAEVDFLNESFVMSNSETAILPWDSTPTAEINHVNTVTASSTHPLFLVLGMQFYQEVNGQMYSLKNGAFNPLAVVLVDTDV